MLQCQHGIPYLRHRSGACWQQHSYSLAIAMPVLGVPNETSCNNVCVLDKAEHMMHLLWYADCTELFLSERGIERLGGFSTLVNLEVLWVNGNKLKVIDHLDANTRMKELYAHVSGWCEHL